MMHDDAYLSAQSLAATFQAERIIVGDETAITFSVTWTSSDAVGVWSVEGSVDGTTWHTLEDADGDLAFSADPNSDNGAAYLTIRGLCWRYLRLAYTAGSGTGTADASYHTSRAS